jgi:hypothetical protein
MKTGAEKQGLGLPILGFIWGVVVLPLSVQADLVGFNYISLSASYSGGVLTVMGQATTEADLDRKEAPASSVHFSNNAPFLLTMNITNVTSTSASGSGTLILTDINGDQITANISGTWDMVFTGLAQFDPQANPDALSGVQFVCGNNCVFEGTSGSFPMTFAAPQPYVGNVQITLHSWFDAPFSGKAADIDGLTFPTQASIIAWRSIRTHAVGGPLPITLNPSASGNGSTGPTVESRSGGIREIAIDFDRQVKLTATPSSGVSITGRQTTYPGGIPTMGIPVLFPPSSISLSGAYTVLLDFNAGVLPDESSYAITVNSGMINQAIFGDHDCNIRSLYGDASGDGRVNLSDAILIKARAGTSVAVNPQLDLDLSNAINQTDVLAAKTRVARPTHQALAP